MAALRSSRSSSKQLISISGGSPVRMSLIELVAGDRRPICSLNIMVPAGRHQAAANELAAALRSAGSLAVDLARSSRDAALLGLDRADLLALVPAGG